MARITEFSVGRRWRCLRENRISFDFVIIGPGEKPGNKRCHVVPLPGQTAIFGERRCAEFVCTQTYTHKHLRSCATLVPLGLDDLAKAVS